MCPATGRIPGAWLADMRSQLPTLGAGGVFANGALILDQSGGVVAESRLSHEAVAAVQVEQAPVQLTPCS